MRRRARKTCCHVDRFSLGENHWKGGLHYQETPNTKILVHTCTIFNNQRFQTTRQYSPHRVDTTNRPFVQHSLLFCIDDIPLLQQDNIETIRLFNTIVPSRFVSNGEILHIYVVCHFADRIESHRFGSDRWLVARRGIYRSDASLQINQHTSSANSATTLANKRGRISFFHRGSALSFAEPTRLLYSHAGIVHNFVPKHESNDYCD